MLTDSANFSGENILETDSNSTGIWHSSESSIDLPLADNAVDRVFTASDEPFRIDDPADALDDDANLAFVDDFHNFHQ